MELRTDRLLLLPFRATDEEDLFRLWNDPQVRRYLWDDQPVAREVVREQIPARYYQLARRDFAPSPGAWALHPD